MKRYASPVLKAVAYPPTMMFVPVELAVLNMGVNAVFLAISNSLISLPPIIWLGTAIVGHILLIGVVSRDAHIVGVLRAIAQAKRSSQNIIPARGVKYVP